MRRFVIPLPGGFDFRVENRAVTIGGVAALVVDGLAKRRLEDRAALGVEKLRFKLPVFFALRSKTHLRGDLEASIAEIIVQTCNGEHVFDKSWGRRIKENFAEKPAHPPLILVFEERRVAPLHTRDGQCVGRADFDESGNIEFAGQARVFAEAKRDAIHPDI